MTFVIGQKAANRKLPADDILLADLAAGMKGTDIARKYGVNPSSVNAHICRNGLRPPKPARPIATALPAEICETHEKIVIRKQGFLSGGDVQMVRIAISLPRIPTIHGHFQGAM